MFKVKKERINFKKKLGSGNFGTVFPYQKDPDDLKWVIKRIHADDTDKLLSFLPEIVIGFSCDHPCIVPVKGYSIEKAEQEDYYIYMKLPRMKQSLKEKFDEKKRSQATFSEEEIVKYFYSLACAIEYLHAKKIFHRDIKLDNILLDHDGEAKLSDIGMAKHVAEEDLYHALSGQAGAVDYTAPEILQLKSKLPKESLKAGDYWSLGLVMLELCALKFRLINPYGSKESIEKSLGGVREKLVEKYSENLLSTIFGLLNLDPKERTNTSEVKKRLEESYKHLFLTKNMSESEKQSEEEKSDNFDLKISMEKLQKFEQGIINLEEEIKHLKQQNSELQKELEVHRSKLNSQMNSQKSTETKIEIVPVSSLNSSSISDSKNLKVLFLAGQSAVGKTQIIRRCLYREYYEDFELTMLDGHTFRASTDQSKTFEFDLYELSGFEEYEVMQENVITRSTIVVIVYDVTNKDSFLHVPKLVKRARRILGEDAILYLVGNKADLIEMKEVELEAAKEFARENKLDAHFEVSAKNGDNCEEFIQDLTRTLIKRSLGIHPRFQPQKPKKFLGLF